MLLRTHYGESHCVDTQQIHNSIEQASIESASYSVFLLEAIDRPSRDEISSVLIVLLGKYFFRESNFLELRTADRDISVP